MSFVKKCIGIFIAFRIPFFTSAIVMPYNDISNYLQAVFVSFTNKVFKLSARSEAGFGSAVLVVFTKIKIIGRVVAHRVASRSTFGSRWQPNTINAIGFPIGKFRGNGIPPFSAGFYIPVEGLHHYAIAVVNLGKVLYL